VRIWMALLSISLVSFLNSLLHSSTNIAIPAIADQLQADAVLVSWIPTAFLLSNVVMLLPAGRLADMYGRKRIYLSGLSLLAIATLLGSLSPSIEWLLLSRVLQGVGAALAVATGMALVMSIFSEHNRGVALGVTSACLYVGLTCGPLIGGWLTESFGWRGVFVFPVPLMGVAFLLVVRNVKGEWKSEHKQPMDWLGSLIFAAGATTLFLGVSSLPGWQSFLMLFLAVALLVSFFYQQGNSAYPLIRFGALAGNRVFSRSLLAQIFIFSSNYPLVFLFSLFLQYIKGYSPLEAGQIMVVQAAVMAVVAPFAGRLSDIYEPRVIATLGCLIMAAAFALLQGVNADTPILLIVTSLMTLGLGFGLFTTPNNNAALSSVDASRLSTGAALLSLARVTGNLFGTAVVLVLISVMIGDAQIEPSQYAALQAVVRWAIAVSFCYTLAAAYFSYTRGRLR